MKSRERRENIALRLATAKEPISGSTLSGEFGVSRQIIVQDIAALKASGYEIHSTHSGYVLSRTPLSRRIFKLYHTTDRTEEELKAIVELGGTVLDVFVRHKVYGKLEAPLNISSKADIRRFIDGVRSGKSTELMTITGGYHYHTVLAHNEDVLHTIEHSLLEKGFLIREN